MSDDAPDWRKVEMVFEAGDPAMSEDFPDWVKGISVAEESPPLGLGEGEYTDWTLKWVNTFTNGLDNSDYCSFNIDDQNGVLSVSWKDSSGKARFGRYNIEDFSTIFESPPGSFYPQCYPNACWGTGTSQFTFGAAYFGCGAISNSISTYTLLGRSDYLSVEIWRGTGASALWQRIVTADDPNATYLVTGAVSLTGKWIVLEVQIGAWGDKNWQLWCYEGS